jgi:hypothetical protein
MTAGDALAIEELSDDLILTASAEAEILLFDLPMD